MRVAAVGGGPAGQGAGPADQASDQAQQQHDQRVDLAAGPGRDRLGGDRDHGSRPEVALAGPGLLDGGLGAVGLGDLEAAEQPVVLVLDPRRGPGGGGGELALAGPGLLDGGLGAARRSWAPGSAPAGTGTAPCAAR